MFKKTVLYLEAKSKLESTKKLEVLINSMEQAAIEELDYHEELSMIMSSAIGYLYAAKETLAFDAYDRTLASLDSAISKLVVDALNEYILEGFGNSEMASQFNENLIIPVMEFKHELIHSLETAFSELKVNKGDSDEKKRS